jgi:hypothetical protein
MEMQLLSFLTSALVSGQFPTLAALTPVGNLVMHTEL